MLIPSDGKAVVRLNLEFEGCPDEVIVPLSYLAIGLSKLSANQPPEGLLTIETDESAIETEFDVPRFLTEKIVKGGTFVWKFNKSDADPWPSPLHGHEYEKGLKLDAISVAR